MMQILNEQALPGGEFPVSQVRYVRSKTDPRVLIAGNSGDCFTRRDGLRWAQPGYKVETTYNDDKTVKQREVISAGAYCDYETFSLEESAA